MKKKIIVFAVAIGLVFPSPTFAFADVPLLIKILANAIEQLVALRKITQSGKDTLSLMRDINHGINDSLSVIDSLAPFMDPGLYKDLTRIRDVTQHLDTVYGTVVDSPEAKVQSDTDEVAAEGISMNTSLFEYATRLDRTADEIKRYSHVVSPGGAQKLTAQSLGVVVHLLDQQLRATALGLKLQAQTMAVQNRKEKTETALYLQQLKVLQRAMEKQDVKFQFPRF